MSTYVKDIKGEFPKAKAIIVGYKEGANKVKIDKIVLHTAFTLSDEPYLIENVQITPQDNLIYLCGHGNAKKQTIGGRKIRDIANLLIRSGWFGQQIYLTSCESNMTLKKDTNISNSLNAILKDRLITKVRKSRRKFIKTKHIKQCTLKHKGRKKNFKKNKHILYKLKQDIKNRKVLIDQIDRNCFVQSDATGSTITIKDDNGEPQIYVIEFDEISEFLADFRTIFIDKKKTRLDSIEINIANLDYLRKQNEKYYKEMQQYKKELLMKYGFKKKTLLYKLKEQIDKIKEECNHSRYM